VVKARGLSTAVPVRKITDVGGKTTLLHFGENSRRAAGEIKLSTRNTLSSLVALAIIDNDTVVGKSNVDQLSFQLPGNASMEGLVDLHNDIMVVVVFISIFVLYLLAVVVWKFNESQTYADRDLRTFTYSLTLEFI
jgi:hypothetical protein